MSEKFISKIQIFLRKHHLRHSAQTLKDNNHLVCWRNPWEVKCINLNWKVAREHGLLFCRVILIKSHTIISPLFLNYLLFQSFRIFSVILYKRIGSWRHTFIDDIHKQLYSLAITAIRKNSIHNTKKFVTKKEIHIW